MLLGIYQKLVRRRLARLSESVEFESEDHYRQKLSVLKESFAGEAQQAEGTPI